MTVTDEDNLVERLDAAQNADPNDLFVQAADRIEALEAENERLRGALKTTINLATAYAVGTGTLFDEGMANARAALAGDNHDQ